MNLKQTNEDKIYMHSSFNQVCLPVLLFLVLCTYSSELRQYLSLSPARLVSSRLVSFPQSLATLVDRGSTYSLTVLRRRTILIFLQKCLLPGHPLRYMCYPLWDHSLSAKVIGSCYLLRNDSHRFTRKRNPAPS